MHDVMQPKWTMPGRIKYIPNKVMDLDTISNKYCPRGEFQKLEEELWSLTMKNSDIVAYTARFSDLVILCPGMVPTESKKVVRFIWSLSPQIQGNVIDAKPLIFYSAKNLAQTLVNHGVRQGFMVPIPEQPKEGGSKKKLWNK